MVISIIAVLMGILLPATGRVKQHARSLLGMNNQKQSATGLSLYAEDNQQRYPESVATLGTGMHWNWTEPLMLIGEQKRSPRLHRALSEYLNPYITDSLTLFCPSTPRVYPYLEQAWRAGDTWDHPETYPDLDPVSGSYCFYFNYTGFLPDTGRIFYGPRGPADARSRSTLVMTDYLGYDHWRSPFSYGSCEKFSRCEITRGSSVSSDYWSIFAGDPPDKHPAGKAKAVFTDTHVEYYSISEAVPLKVSISPDGSMPYPDGIGPGVFYLPGSAIK